MSSKQRDKEELREHLKTLKYSLETCEAGKQASLLRIEQYEIKIRGYKTKIKESRAKLNQFQKQINHIWEIIDAMELEISKS